MSDTSMDGEEDFDDELADEFEEEEALYADEVEFDVSGDEYLDDGAVSDDVSQLFEDVDSGDSYSESESSSEDDVEYEAQHAPPYASLIRQEPFRCV